MMTSCGQLIPHNVSPSWFCNLILLVGFPAPEDGFTSAEVFTATAAILALNAAFLLFICVAAVADTVRGEKFLPIYPGDPSLFAPALPNTHNILGNRRAPM